MNKNDTELAITDEYVIKYKKYKSNYFEFDEKTKFLKCFITVDKEDLKLFCSDDISLKVNSKSLFGELFSFDNFDPDKVNILERLSTTELRNVIYYIDNINIDYDSDINNVCFYMQLVNTNLGEVVNKFLIDEKYRKDKSEIFIRVRYCISKCNDIDNSIIAIDFDLCMSQFENIKKQFIELDEKLFIETFSTNVANSLNKSIESSTQKMNKKSEASKKIIDRMNKRLSELEKDVCILKSMEFCMPTIPDKIKELRETINKMIY